ncbi:MAG: RsmE family RNA methyltransferase, partial [Ferruginibacter sp.]
MTLPFFYIEHIVGTPDFLELNEETSKHALQVLRMQKSEQLQLTDGNGNLFTARIIDDNKKKCKVEILAAVNHKPSLHNKTIAISLIKNTNRLEWFLEKAGEIGVSEIAPLI